MEMGTLIIIVLSICFFCAVGICVELIKKIWDLQDALDRHYLEANFFKAECKRLNAKADRFAVASTALLSIFIMRLTIRNRIRIAWEVLTSRSGHDHPSQEKQLSIFQRGYDAGMKDAKLSLDDDAAGRIDEGDSVKSMVENEKEDV